MKKIKFLFFTLAILMAAQNIHANILGLGVKVTVTSRAYWDGTGCVPRDKGGCVHIEFNMPSNAFQLNNADGSLTLQANSEILNNPNYKDLFSNGTFYIGAITIEKNALIQVKYSGSNSFPDKRYQYSEKNGVITIYLN
jgi:hypothetical protein